MQDVDSILYPRWLIPVEPIDRVLEEHALVIDKQQITDILPAIDAKQNYSTKNSVELNKHALIPGLINAHCHAAMTLLRGFADDLPLMQWLQHHIWPAESKYVSADMIKDGTQLAIAEMLLSGTTCVHDMYFFPEIAAEQYTQVGMRAHLGIPCIEGVSNAWAKDIEECLQKGLQTLDDFKQNPLIDIHFAPHAPYTVSDHYLVKISQLADEHQTHVQMHVHETADEVTQGLDNDKKRPLQRLHDLKLLTSQLTAIHLTQLTDQEIELLAETGTRIVHCPESNLKLASGFCPVAKLLNAKANVALGTDGAASNNDLDMLGEMRTAALLGKAVAEDATALAASTALQMATSNAAKALGLDQITGTLSVGKAADIVAIDLSELANQPLYHPISQIVYTTTRQQVSDVWVAGQRVVKERQLTTVDQQKLERTITDWQQRIADH